MCVRGHVQILCAGLCVDIVCRVHAWNMLRLCGCYRLLRKRRFQKTKQNNDSETMNLGRASSPRYPYTAGSGFPCAASSGFRTPADSTRQVQACITRQAQFTPCVLSRTLKIARRDAYSLRHQHMPTPNPFTCNVDDSKTSRQTTP